MANKKIAASLTKAEKVELFENLFLDYPHFWDLTIYRQRIISREIRYAIHYYINSDENNDTYLTQTLKQ